MTVVYVTTGAWGAGTGTPNSAAQVDGNFYDVDQRIVTLNADLAEGKRIDTVTYASNSMTFHYTDSTSQVIPLPVATLQYVGNWTNDTPYMRGHMITADNGFYQVLEGHTTPAAPAPFNPNATTGAPDNLPLYGLFLPLNDVNYDAAIFVPGSVQRAAGELLFQGIANRSMWLGAGDEGAYARLDVANPVGAASIVLSIQKNGTQIGTITIAANAQVGTFNIPAATDFVEGDRYALRVTTSTNATPAGLSVTLPFVRTDI
jgi:hypothetical protein